MKLHKSQIESIEKSFNKIKVKSLKLTKEEEGNHKAFRDWITLGVYSGKGGVDRYGKVEVNGEKISKLIQYMEGLPNEACPNFDFRDIKFEMEQALTRTDFGSAFFNDDGLRFSSEDEETDNMNAAGPSAELLEQDSSPEHEETDNMSAAGASAGLLKQGSSPKHKENSYPPIVFSQQDQESKKSRICSWGWPF